MKCISIRSYSGPYIPAFGLKTDQNNSEYEHVLRYVAQIRIILAQIYLQDWNLHMYWNLNEAPQISQLTSRRFHSVSAMMKRWSERHCRNVWDKSHQDQNQVLVALFSQDVLHTFQGSLYTF